MCHIATSQIKDIQQIWVFYYHKPCDREVEILYFWEISSIVNGILLARFCLKSYKNSKNEQLLSHFYGHFDTFTPQNGKFTISPQSPILNQISLFDLWAWHSYSYLSSKTWTVFLLFLVPDLQPNVPVTRLKFTLNFRFLTTVPPILFASFLF